MLELFKNDTLITMHLIRVLMIGQVFCSLAAFDFEIQFVAFLIEAAAASGALNSLLNRALDFHFFLAVQIARA